MSPSLWHLLGLPCITQPYPHSLLFQVLSFFPQEDGKFSRMYQGDTLFSTLLPPRNRVLASKRPRLQLFYPWLAVSLVKYLDHSSFSLLTCGEVPNPPLYVSHGTSRKVSTILSGLFRGAGPLSTTLLLLSDLRCCSGPQLSLCKVEQGSCAK